MGSSGFGTKVEVKNLNSFRSLERAMEFEVERHAEALERGERLVQETRGWDENGGRTISQRTKEEANDYRYFPEPDLPPLRPSHDWIAEIREAMPELPAARRERYEEVLGLSAYDAGVLTADVALADYFDRVVAAGIAPKSAANWVTGEFSRLLNQHAADGLRASDVALTPEGLAELIGEVDGGPRVGHQCQGRAGHRVRQRRVAARRDRARGAGAGPRRGADRTGSGGGAGRVPGAGGAVPRRASSRSTASWWGRS